MTDNQAARDNAVTSYRHAPTRTVSVGGVSYAYRELGPTTGVPVVFLTHLAAVLDNWDPRVVDGIAAQHRVITFDNRGVGASTGKTPDTIQAMATDAVTFIRALGLERVDLLGFSMGGMIAQLIAHDQPRLVRKLILAGTGPAGGEGITNVTKIAHLDFVRGALTLQDPKQFLFFTRTANGRRAGKEFLSRLKERTENRDKAISIRAYLTQLKAIHRWGLDAPADLSVIGQPVLVANGESDRMVPSKNSADLARQLPNSDLVIYPDAGHGGIFQFHEQFVGQALLPRVMKAFIVDKYGKDVPLRAGELPAPVPGEHDVLIAVHAAGVNPIDSKIKTGEFKLILPFNAPFVLGRDLAGVVTAVGSAVRRFVPGDEVYASLGKANTGAFAELVAVNEDEVARKPAGLSMAEAAALPMVTLTAWQALVEKTDVRPGDRVLIHAGSGGVGSIAIQLAKHLGAHVATTTSTGNVDWVRALGADEVIDYRTQDFATVLHDYDLVLDSLSGKTLEESVRVVRSGGLVIGIGGPPDPAFAGQLGKPQLRPVMALLSRKIRRLARRNQASYSFLFMRADGAQLSQITSLVDTGMIHPVLDRVFDFADTVAALDYVNTGRAKGKVVITMT